MLWFLELTKKAGCAKRIYGSIQPPISTDNQDKLLYICTKKARLKKIRFVLEHF